MPDTLTASGGPAAPPTTPSPPMETPPAEPVVTQPVTTTAPTTETPPPPAPPEEQAPLPAWDEIKNTDQYKQATKDQRADILSTYTQQMGKELKQKVGDDPAAVKEATDQLTQFYKREADGLGSRYSVPVNMAASFAHGAITGVTNLPEEIAQTSANIAKEAAKHVEPGVIVTQSDIRGMSVDQAVAQLQEQEDLKKDIDSKVQAAGDYVNAAQRTVGLTREQRDKVLANAPAAKLFPGGPDQAARVMRSAGYVDKRIDALRKYIDSGGDPNAVAGTDFEAPGWTKATKAWGETAITPDEAFIKQHPILNTSLNNFGYSLAFIGTRSAAIALSGGLGAIPEVAEGIGITADATVQLIDTYQQSYQGALAKIDERIKNGEPISPQQRDKMAADDASMNLWNVPFLTFSNMLVGRIMGESHVTRDVAESLKDRFVDNVLKPGIKEAGTQIGIGGGIGTISAISDQMSGVDKGGFNLGAVGERAKESAISMGLPTAVFGVGFRGLRTLAEYRGDQSIIDYGANLVKVAGKAQLQTAPGKNQDDVYEALIKTLVPAHVQDAVRAKLKLGEAADIQKEVSGELAKDSPQTKAEMDKGAIESDQQVTTPPTPKGRPTPPKPGAMTPEVREATGGGLIDQALASKRITPAQHTALTAAFEENPGDTLQELGRLMGLSKEGATKENIEGLLTKKTPPAKEEPKVPPKEEVTPAPVIPKEEEEVAPAPAPTPTPTGPRTIQQDLTDALAAGKITKAQHDRFQNAAIADPEFARKQLERVIGAPPAAPAAEPVTPAEPATPTRAQEHLDLLKTVNDYLGPEAREDATQKLEFGRDFAASVPEADRPAAFQLLHRLHLEELPEGEHADWAAIPAEQQANVMRLMHKFIADRTAAEGRAQAEKPVFKKALTIAELNNFHQADDAEGFQNRLMAGQEASFHHSDINPELDEWLYDHGFGVDAVGEQNIIRPYTETTEEGKKVKLYKTKTGYQQLVEREKRLEAAQKGKVGRPPMETYAPSETTDAYQKETEAMPSHPAEEEEIEKVLPQINRRLSVEPSGQLVAQATSRYRRQLRVYAKRMVDAGRNDDLNLLRLRTGLEVELEKLDPDSRAHAQVTDALKKANEEVERTGADKPIVNTRTGEVHEFPQIGVIIKSILGQYGTWEKSYAERHPGFSLQEKLGEEGEATKAETVGTEWPPKKLTKTPAYLDSNPAEEVPEFIKLLRTDEEKAFAYNIANRLAAIRNRPQVPVPANLPALPHHAKPTLFTRIFDEYTRFLESRHPEPRPTGEGGEEGGTATATAAGGIGLSPGRTEENAPYRGPGDTGRGGEAGGGALREPAALAAGDQGTMAERDITGSQRRATIAGYPERTGEDAARTGPGATQLGPGPTSASSTGTIGRQIERAGTAAAGTERRDAITGERISVTPEGAERARHAAPTITPDEQADFNKTIEPAIIKTADRIWLEWQLGKQGAGEPGYGKAFGLNQKDYDNVAQVRFALRQLVKNMVRQDPTLAGRVNLAKDILLGIPQFYEENMSASQQARQKVYATQTTPVTGIDQVRKIWGETLQRFRPAFNALGVNEVVNLKAGAAGVIPWSSGRIDLQHNPDRFYDYVRRNLGMTEGQLRGWMESAAQEELIHAAQFGWYREQWVRNPGKIVDPKTGITRNKDFLEFQREKTKELRDSFEKARNDALKKKNYKLADDLDNALGTSIYHYFGPYIKGADTVTGWDSYHTWLGTLTPDQAKTVQAGMPWELARQLTQLKLSGRTTEFSFQHLIHQVIDVFMSGLRHLRAMSLKVSEGAMGPAWKDTINVLETRVRHLQEMLDSTAPPKTRSTELSDDSKILAYDLGYHFFNDRAAARQYGYDFPDVAEHRDMVSKIIDKLKAKFGNNFELIHGALHGMAVKEGLIQPSEYTTPMAVPGSKTLYSGTIASMAPGLGEVHNLDEGKPDQLARFLRHAPDPEMREFAKSITTHRAKLLPITLHQLNNDVPAAFYHDGDLYVTKATLTHPDGQKALAHELQHAVAQEIVTNPERPVEHEAAAHARALVDEFRANLPADIRDAADHKLPELLAHADASGHLNINQLTDEERRWLPLMEASQNPSEYVKKAFSSANFRDFLRNTKAGTGGSLWDKANAWGKTLFGDQAFKYAPEVSDITYNRPGAVMKRDPRVRNAALNPSDPDLSGLLTLGPKIDEQLNKLPKELRDYFNSFFDPLASYREGTLKLDTPKNPEAMKLLNLYAQQKQFRDNIIDKTGLNFPNQRLGQKYDVAKGAQAVLKRIADISENPFHQTLAYTLGKVLERNPDITVSLNRAGNDEYLFTGDHIKIDAYHTNEHFEQAMLHEVTHALVSGKISAYLTGRMDLLTPEEKTAIGELERLRQVAINWGIKNQHLPPEFLSILNAGSYERRYNLWEAMARGDKKYRDHSYGLIDPNEFASEAFSNLAFQNYLKKIPYSEVGRKPTTMWGKFIDWAKGILGFRRATPEGNAFDAVMENLSKVMKGQRLMAADFKLGDTTGPKTSRQSALQMMTDFLERKAEAEGYASLADVPEHTRNAWAETYQSETLYTGQFQPKDWAGVIAAPKQGSMLVPSKELAQKTAPEDIVDHIAKATGTNHLDSEGLRKATDQAYHDGAIRPGQYIGIQPFLDSLENNSVRRMNPLAWATGSKEGDPNSPERKLKRWGRNFLAQGNLPKEIHEMQLRYIEYSANELAHKGRAWVREFNRILKKDYGAVKDVRFVPEQTMELFNNVLTNQYKSMPKGMTLDMWNHLKSGRVMLDQLSQDLLRNGIAAPESDLYLKIEKGLGAKPGMGLTIAPGQGSYVSRSYRLITDPRFSLDENLRKQYWNAAIAPMKDHWIDVQSQEAAQKAARVYRPGTSAYEEARVRAYWSRRNRLEDSVTDTQVEQHMTELLLHYAQTAEARQQPGKTFGPAFMLNDKIITDLTHMPEEFRRLMGEERDVRTNLVNTLFRQNRFLHTMQLTKEMYEAGKGKYFGDAADPANGLTHQITPEMQFQRVQGATPEEQVRFHSVFGKLAGKWTTKEINDFILGYDKLLHQDPNLFWKTLNWAEGSARYLTTILSIHRGVGNLFAANFSMIQNGMMPLDVATSRATSAYWQHIFGGTDAQRDQVISEAMRYGVLDKNIDQSILNGMMNKASKYAEYGRGPLDFLEAIGETAAKHKIWSKVQLGAQEAKEFMLKFHTAGNDIAKMAQWEAKQRFLREADDWDVKNRGTEPKTDEQIKQEAAQIVRDTNISYSLASPALKRARATPVIGTFLTYWNEMARSYTNQLGYARKYLLSKNPVEQQEGIKRVAGLAFGGALAFCMGAISRQMFGITNKQDQQLRALLPPWEQNDIRVYLGQEKDGRLIYVNMNYVMPQGDLARGLMALLTPNPHGPAGNVLDAGAEILHPTYNVGLIPGALADVLRNQTEYGTQVYNPDDDILPKSGAITSHIMGRWWGGTLGRSFQQLPNLGKVTPGGNIYDPYILAGKEFLGQDIHYVSIPDRFRSSLFSSSDEIKNAQKIFNSPIQRTGNVMTDSQIKDTYLHMERIRFIEFNRLHDKVEAAINSGMSVQAVRNMMKERGYSRSLIDDLLAGRYYSYRPGKEVLQNARANGNIIPYSLFSSTARDYEEEPEKED